MSLFLYNEKASNLQDAVEFAESRGCDATITSIAHQNFNREFIRSPISTRHLNFTRSSLLVEAATWRNHLILKLSNDVTDCDSTNATIRGNAESTLVQEIEFAQHCTVTFTILRLKNTNTVNLARLTQKLMHSTLLLEVPMVDPYQMTRDLRNTDNFDVEEADTWQWWNKFRAYGDYSIKFKVALELTADLPSKEELRRWLGEPVELLIITSDVFISNANNYPVLPKAHKSVVVQFLKMKASLAIKTNIADSHHLRNCVAYLKHLIGENQKDVDVMNGYDDLLEIPLQPLYDNLDSFTYEVFEKDPVKYILYQRAIEAALRDRIPDSEIDKRTAVVMVFGAGRGPLVRSSLNASKNTKRKIKVIVVEKNPNAIVTLTALKDELWTNEDVTIISKDMRYLELDEKADILVSELLGSFGDNELAPECLDGAQKHLKPDGVSIPSKSTSYLNPVMSPKLFSAIRELRNTRHREMKPQTYEVQSESTYVVYVKNAYHIADAQKVFEFEHPNLDEVIDNRRFIKLKFDAPLDCVLTGFVGYFDAVLYKDIKISIHPIEHSEGMCSWFPLYIPLSEAQQIQAGNKIEMNIWRCVASNKVWYEWNTTAPFISHIHNQNGEACPIYK